MIPLKQILLICAVVTLMEGCASIPKVAPNSPEAKAAIRKAAKKPTGELTQADLKTVTKLNLGGNKLTDVKGLEKLMQLTHLNLENNPDLTKAQIDELQKALPKCKILSNTTK